MKTDRLATLDEFGGRNFVIPAEVHGRFRTARRWVYAVLVLIFLALPWMKIGGLQAVWIDIPHRHFEMFGHLFLAHDTPLLFLILGAFVAALAYVTAVWGRVWCGWACPQTVFIDAIYRQIEIWVEGNYLARRKLQSSPLSFTKVFKSTLKWALYFLVSSIFAHSFIAYFSGSDNLLHMTQGSPQDNWTYFCLVLFVTALLMFNFGWFREQFCLIMCPYGRFQSVLMDPDSVTVTYDTKRGEPRKGPASGPVGDCVSCNRCVQVCPTGIDIRNGLQMECIGCTACIDACNEIMAKVHKAPDLIAYKTSRGTKARPLRARALACLALFLVCVLSLFFAVGDRKAFAASVLRATDAPYQNLPGGLVMNHFKVHYLNQSHEAEEFELALPQELEARGVVLAQAGVKTSVGAGESSEPHFFLTFPLDLLKDNGELQIQVLVREGRTGTTEPQTLTLVGPRR